MVQLLLSYQRRWALKSVNAWSTLFVQFNMSIRTCKWLIKETARLFHVQFNTLTANTKKSSKLNSCPIKQVNCIGIGLHALNETLFKIIVILRRLSFGWFVFSIVACIQKKKFCSRSTWLKGGIEVENCFSSSAWPKQHLIDEVLDIVYTDPHPHYNVGT